MFPFECNCIDNACARKTQGKVPCSKTRQPDAPTLGRGGPARCTQPACSP
jgi:hypothetical protein